MALSRRHLLATLACAAGCTSASPSSAGVGAKVPRLTGVGLDGEYAQLEDHTGDVILVNVWATWCAPCMAELPELQRLHRALRDRGFTVVAISEDTERAEQAVRDAVAELGLTFPVWLDPSSQATERLRLSGYPASVVVGRDGVITWRRDGMITPGDHALLGAIETALARPREAT